MIEFQENINWWAEDRGILKESSPLLQFSKLLEEVLELHTELILENFLISSDEHAKDAIGDCMVVLAIIAKMLGTDLSSCADQAWGEIKSRKGKMIGGKFVKDV